MQELEIKITILHSPEYGVLDKNEIISDIRSRFKENTGYDVERISIKNRP